MNKPKLIILFLFIAVTAYCADVTGPEPAPWWQRQEDAVKFVQNWATALTVIAGIVIAFVSFVWGKVIALRDQIRLQSQQQADALKLQSDRLNTHANQITTLAMTSAPPSQTITQNNPPATPP